MLGKIVENVQVHKNYPEQNIDASFESWKDRKTVYLLAAVRKGEVEPEKIAELKKELGVVDGKEEYFATWLKKANPPGGAGSRIKQMGEFFVEQLAGNVHFQTTLFHELTEKAKSQQKDNVGEMKTCFIVADVTIGDKQKYLVSMSGSSDDVYVDLHRALASMIASAQSEKHTINPNDIIVCEFANLNIKENMLHYNQHLSAVDDNAAPLTTAIDKALFQKTCAELPLLARIFKHQIHEQAKIKVNAVANLAVSLTKKASKKGSLDVVANKVDQKGDHNDFQHFKVRLIPCCPHCVAIKEPMTDLLVFGSLAAQNNLHVPVSPLLSRKDLSSDDVAQKRLPRTSLFAGNYMQNKGGVWDGFQAPNKNAREPVKVAVK